MGCPVPCGTRGSKHLHLQSLQLRVMSFMGHRRVLGVLSRSYLECGVRGGCPHSQAADVGAKAQPFLRGCSGAAQCAGSAAVPEPA